MRSSLSFPALVYAVPLVALASLTAPTAALAQDAAVVNPQTVTVRLENDRVRVLEATLPPGAREQPHSHPAYVMYVMSGSKVKNHLADGTVAEGEIVAGQTLYRDAVSHWAENVGTTPIHVILVELKTPAASPSDAPAASPQP